MRGRVTGTARAFVGAAAGGTVGCDEGVEVSPQQRAGRGDAGQGGAGAWHTLDDRGRHPVRQGGMWPGRVREPWLGGLAPSHSVVVAGVGVFGTPETAVGGKKSPR